MKTPPPTPADLALARAEEQSKGVQEIANDALKTMLFAIELAKITAKTIAEIPQEDFKERASDDLKEFAPAYAAVASLPLPENLLEAKVAQVRKAIGILKIVP
jgi:hypothetical protein